MKARALFSIVPLIALAACAKRPGQQVAQDLAVLKSEETPEKLLERGRAFAEVGDLTRAEQYLAGALERGADPKVVMPVLLKVCIAERRYRAAIDYAEPYLKKHPGDFRLRFLLASLYATTGETKAARVALERILEDRPNFAPARFAYAVLLRDDIGDPAGADAQFREYLMVEPQGPHAEEARGSLLRSVTEIKRVGPLLPPSIGDAPPDAQPPPKPSAGPVKVSPPQKPGPGPTRIP